MNGNTKRSVELTTYYDTVRKEKYKFSFTNQILHIMSLLQLAGYSFLELFAAEKSKFSTAHF